MTCRQVTRRTVKTTKNGGLGQNHPLRVNFQNASIKVLYRTAIDVSPVFHADLSRYKEMRIHCTCCKNCHSSHRHYVPIWRRAPTFYYMRSDFGLQPVKFYPDLLRFAGVIRHIIPSRYTESVCALMFHMRTKILNYC